MKWMDVKQLSQYIPLTECAIKNKAYRGQIPAYKRDGKWFFSSDEKGQMGAKLAAGKIGIEHCRNIALPGCRDIAEFFGEKGYTIEEFRELARKAQRFKDEK